MLPRTAMVGAMPTTTASSWPATNWPPCSNIVLELHWNWRLPLALLPPPLLQLLLVTLPMTHCRLCPSLIYPVKLKQFLSILL